MNVNGIMRALRKGATIEKGSFSGYWLRLADGTRERLSGLQAAYVLVKCQRIDDHKTQTGATWALMNPATNQGE